MVCIEHQITLNIHLKRRMAASSAVATYRRRANGKTVETERAGLRPAISCIESHSSLEHHISLKTLAVPSSASAPHYASQQYQPRAPLGGKVEWWVL